MTNIKISELNELTSVATDDFLPIVDISATETKKVSVNNLVPELKNTYSESTSNAYSCDYVNEALIETYSTSEVKTNKVWIDGKPIYRKVLQGGSIGTSSVVYANTGVNNISLMTSQEGYGLTGSGNVFPLNRANGSAFQYQGTFFFEKSNNRFAIETGSSVSYASYYIIMEYTKTTD